MRILVVEDDDALARALSRVLTEAGYAVDVVGDGHSAQAAFATESFDLIILDLNLPGIDGLSLLKALRHDGIASPVLVLTAKSSPGDKVRGLDLGADDYISKPFDVSELEARVRVLLRRGMGVRAPSITFGDLTFDLKSRAPMVDGALLDMPARELSVLEALIAKQGKVVSKQAIIESLSAFDEELSPNAVETYISRLRRKLEQHGLTVKTARGIGYYLVRQAN
jgi:two-component system OmpR family response regulator